MPDGDRMIVIKLRDDVILPYVDQAEASLDPALRVAWDVLVAQFPFLTLFPLYGGIGVEVLRDLRDGIRSRGEEPPNLLATFATPCPPAQVANLLMALAAVAFVDYAEEMVAPVLATVDFGSNPLTRGMIHADAAPAGIDAYYAWDVPGGDGAGIRFVDVESDWMLDHEDLRDAQVAFASVASPSGTPSDRDHGTGVLGIVLACDNDRGSVGITPAVQGFVVPDRPAGDDAWRGTGWSIVVAALVVGAGGILLIEMQRPSNLPDPAGFVPVELDRHVFDAIQFATGMGVIVVEPAGNGGIDLDAFVRFARLQRGTATFADSGAIIVAEAAAAGEDGQPMTWQRRDMSTFGSRIDCFADGRARVPSALVPPPGRGYDTFGGTSGASAVIAGAAVAVQGMWLHHTGSFLPPSEVRRLLADVGLNTLSAASSFVNPNADRIGVMPNLRGIARSIGAHRFIGVSVVRRTADQLDLVGVDDNNEFFRRLFRPGLNWTMARLLDLPNRVAPRPCALVCRGEARLDALAIGGDGELRLTWWEANGSEQNTWLVVSGNALLSSSNTLAAAVSGSAIDVYAVREDGRLAWARSPAEHPMVQFFDFAPLDTVASFVGSAGPAAASNALGGTDVVAVDRDGQLRWGSRPPEGVIPTISGLAAIGGLATRAARTVRPALVSRPAMLDALVVGIDGLLYHTAWPAFGIQGWRDLRQIGGPIALSTAGNVAALSREPLSADAFAIDADGHLNWTSATLLPFVDWHDLQILDPTVLVSAAGGIAAVSRTPDTMEVFAFDLSGELLWTRWSAASGWTPQGPLPLEPPIV